MSSQIGKRKIHVANADEKSWVGDGPYDYRRWVLYFGSIGTTYVLSYARTLGDALEISAGFLFDRGWTGYFEEPEIEDGSTRDCPDAKEGRPCTCDLTYTESGYLASWEWGIVFESASPQDLVKFYHADRRG